MTTKVDELPIDNQQDTDDFSLLISSLDESSLHVSVERFTAWGESHGPNVWFNGLRLNVARTKALVEVLNGALLEIEKRSGKRTGIAMATALEQGFPPQSLVDNGAGVTAMPLPEYAARWKVGDRAIIAPGFEAWYLKDSGTSCFSDFQDGCGVTIKEPAAFSHALDAWHIAVMTPFGGVFDLFPPQYLLPIDNQAQSADPQVDLGMPEGPQFPLKSLGPWVDNRIECPKCGKRDTSLMAEMHSKQRWECDNCNFTWIVDIDQLPSETDALRGIDDQKDDAGYSHCKRCDRSTVQVFDGKDWVCEACGWSVTQPAAPFKVGDRVITKIFTVAGTVVPGSRLFESGELWWIAVDPGNEYIHYIGNDDLRLYYDQPQPVPVAAERVTTTTKHLKRNNRVKSVSLEFPVEGVVVSVKKAGPYMVEIVVNGVDNRRHEITCGRDDRWILLGVQK